MDPKPKAKRPPLTQRIRQSPFTKAVVGVAVLALGGVGQTAFDVETSLTQPSTSHAVPPSTYQAIVAAQTELRNELLTAQRHSDDRLVSALDRVNQKLDSIQREVSEINGKVQILEAALPRQRR